MTSVPSPAPPYARQEISPWFIRLPILVLSGVILLMLILTILLGLFQWRFYDRIVPGVSAFGIDLAGMTPEEARATLDSRFSYDEDAVFTFRDGDRFWQLSAGELGVMFDAQATAVEAAAQGHSGNLFMDVLDQGLIWLNGHGVAPIIRYDQNVAVDRLMQIAQEINRPVQDATLTIAGGTVSATPSQTGRTVDILATLDQLNDTIQALGTGSELPLVVRETPPRIVDSDEAARKAQIALSNPIVLVAEDASGQPLGPWTANVQQIAQILRADLIDRGDGSLVYDVSLDMTVFSAYLESLAPGLITTPENARFQFNDSTGQLEVMEPGRDGRSLNVEQTLARMQQAVFEPGARTAMMAFDYEQAPYHEGITAAELGITELVAQATTYYAGSTQPRRDNIAEAARRFNGLIIGPGEIFSFNEWLGDVSEASGFVEGMVIINGRTAPGVGGGVCQVSTTAFQAAFYAGFPILERHEHAYQVGYYLDGEGQGMDASVYTPDLDFRFLNDTPYSLLIETSVFPSSNSMQFRFYSTNPGRQVVKEGPTVANVQPALPTRYEENPALGPGQSRQVDWAAQGADVTVVRRILDLDGNEISRDSFVSRYQPWGAIIEVAPGNA